MRRRLSPERKKAGCPVGTPRQLQANGLPDVFDRLPHQALVWQLLLAAVQHCGQHASRASPQQAAQLAPQQSVAQQLADAAFALAFAEQQFLALAAEHALTAADLSAPTQHALPPLAQQAAPLTQQSGKVWAAESLAARPEPTARVSTANAATAQEQTNTRFVHMEISSNVNGKT